MIVCLCAQNVGGSWVEAPTGTTVGRLVGSAVGFVGKVVGMVKSAFIAPRRKTVQILAFSYLSTISSRLPTLSIAFLMCFFASLTCTKAFFALPTLQSSKTLERLEPDPSTS